MNPKCIQCEKTETILWRKNTSGAEICNECYELNLSKLEAEKEVKQEIIKEEPVKELETVVRETKIRKSTRSTRFKNKAITRQKSKSTSRRSIFKKNIPNKTPNISAETKTKTNVFHNGTYYQIGDIVSLISRGKKYYAQIRCLIEDTFCEKSAVLTWLVPTTSSPDPEVEFDAATYLVGMEEDIPRRIANTMTFVAHSSSNYFINKNEPYARPEIYDALYSPKNKRGFIWTGIN